MRGQIFLSSFFIDFLEKRYVIPLKEMTGCTSHFLQREPDSNGRPLGYEPNELPLLHPAIFVKFILQYKGSNKFRKYKYYIMYFCLWRIYVARIPMCPEAKKKSSYFRNCFILRWQHLESNQGHKDFQSFALLRPQKLRF